MQQSCTCGSVRGASGNWRSYRDPWVLFQAPHRLQGLRNCRLLMLFDPTTETFSGFPLSLSVLLVTDLFHPVDNLAVELLLNSDVRQGRGRRSPMPVLLAGREPYHIA
jgi:hypothetical protein